MKPVQKYGICLLVAIALDLIIELLSRRNFIYWLQFVIYSPITFTVNVIIIFTTLCLIFLFRRRIFALSVLSCIWFIMGIINAILLGFHFRTTPLTGQDLKLIGSALELAPKYLSIPLIIGFILLLLLLIAGVVFVFRKAPVYQGKIYYIRNGLVCIFMVWFTLMLNELCVYVGIFPTNFSNIAEAYQQHGFAYCFANSLLNTGIAKPEGYGSDTMTWIADNKNLIESDESEENTEESSNPERETDFQQVEPVSLSSEDETGTEILDKEKQSPNIIFIQLESFFDITNANNLEFSKDPIPNIHKLQKDYTAGYVSVPSIGAGTANTEFEVITGMNLDFFGPGEYPYKTILKKTTCESIAYNLLELGWRTHAVHNNNATFYDRMNVFPGLGFETFTSLEYMAEQEYTPIGWAKDKGLIREMLKVLDSTDGSDFIYTISVQGHGSYPEEEVLENPEVEVFGDIEDSRKYAITYYVNQIYEMDQFVGRFIECLENRDELTVLVLFGDHLPTLDFTQEEIEGATLFQTPYVIWDNLGLEKHDRDLEAYQLSSWVLQQLDIHRGIMVRFHQVYFKEMDEKGESESESSTLVDGEEENENEGTMEDAYLQEMELLEYDMLYGEKDVFDGENPYELIDMKMGVSELVIKNVKRKEEHLFVIGKNFTPYTVISVNGKQYETEYIYNNIVMAMDVPLEEENEIAVLQVDKDGIVLSESEKYDFQYMEETDSSH